MTSTTGVSSTHTYRGNSEINFFLSEKDGLAVTIDTDKLHIRSVQSSEKDLNNYAALFGDRDVMEKFATGETKTKEEMKSRIDNTWVKRWRAKDPYSGMAVFKKDKDEFLGHIVLGHGDTPGQSELAYLFMKKHWNQGFGTESVTAIVKEYAPATVKEGYKLEGKTLEKIKATTRTDNLASLKILEKLMHKTGEENKYGALRCNFAIDLIEIMKKV